MKKSTKKALSLALALIMMLSLLPVSAFAEGDRGIWEVGDVTPIDLPEPLPEDPEEPEEEIDPNCPEQGFVYFDDESGLEVEVEAPEGALPLGVDLAVTPVLADDYQAQVDELLGSRRSILVAMDISFVDEETGEEFHPNLPVTVKVFSPELDSSKDLTIVHIPDAEDEENAPEVILQLPEVELGDELGANGVAFDAKDFSVYVVVGEGESGDEARATVNFISKGTTIATVYVKNSDTVAELEDIVYDPGTGALASGEKFLGWSTVEPEDHTADMAVKTIPEIRTDLAALSIVEGETTVNYYAVIARTVTLTYMDPTNTVALSSVSGTLIGKTTSFDVTLDQPYTPDSAMSHFEGWIVQTGAPNISKAVDSEGTEITNGGSEEHPYLNGTTLTITGDVVLGVTAPEGNWLVFNENGKGATYVAPQFVESGHVTQEPTLTMTRNGYTFGGWYTDEACTTPFTFGEEIHARTEIYAKWNPKETANYTVIIWKQNVNGEDYDFAESVTIQNAAVGSTTSAVTATGTGDNRFASVNGTAKRWTGFHLDRYDTGKTVSTEGTTVVNVYYNRNQITLKFYTFNATGYERSYDSSAQTGVMYYGRSGNQWSGYSYFRIYYYEGSWIYESGGSYYYYTGNRYIRTGSWSEQTSYQMQGLYGAQLNKTWPTAYNWYDTQYPGGSAGGTRTTFLDAFLPSDGSSTVNFYGQTVEGNISIRFYKQNANDNGYTVANTVTASAGNFYISDKYNGFHAVDYAVDGGAKTSVGAKDAATGYYNGGEGVSFTTGLDIYFDRDEYSILYYDGVYVDGNDNPVEGMSSTGQLNVVEGVRYGSNTTPYNKDGANYYAPTKSGFTFAGWYMDDSCTHAYTFTTMPEGITVYAKWIQNQYRVFLRPEAGTDPSLDWGSATQAMNFRITDGTKASFPTGRRSDYKFVGWYTAPGLAGDYFDPDVTPLNEDTVPAEPAYDKTADFTDTMDRWGNGATTNADVNRPWITRKLVLYAHWSKILPGAEGIGVVYNAGEGGSGVPADATLYQDGARAVAQSAVSKPPKDKQFECWIVQKWNGSAWEDTSVEVYPGGEFFIIADDAKQEAAPDNSAENPHYYYTIQLMAKYKDKEDPTPTQITWYSNHYDVSGLEIAKDDLSNDATRTYEYEAGKGYYYTVDEVGDHPLAINEAIPIPGYETYTAAGYTFLGWAKIDSPDPTKRAATDPSTLTEDDLFLKWEDGKYLAKDDSGDWTVNAAKVAADERAPIEDLYALWSAEFYVVHSGLDNADAEQNVVTVQLTRSALTDATGAYTGTYDLTANLTPGTLYGGYYVKESGATSMAITANSAKYDGTNWTWTDMATAPGNAIIPKAGATYYIKEVPADTYLQPYFHYTYHKEDGKISSAWLISDVDDNNYQETGFEFINKDNEATVCKSLTVQNATGGTSIKLTPKRVFGTKGAVNTNLLTYREVMKACAGLDGFADGVKILQYWVTPDGLIVTGIAARTYTGTANKDGVGIGTEETVASTIKLFVKVVTGDNETPIVP